MPKGVPAPECVLTGGGSEVDPDPPPPSHSCGLFRPRASLSSSGASSSDGFSSFDEASIPAPGQLQRTSAVEFGAGGQQQVPPPEDPAPMGSLRKGWDTFRLAPPKPDRRGRGALYASLLQLLKLSTFLALFLLTLGASILAKCVTLLMAAGLGQAGANVPICADKIPEAAANQVFISTRNAAKWAWALLLALCVPEWLCFARSLHRSLFRRVRAPSCAEFLAVLLVESVHALGLGALCFALMPQPDSALALLQLGSALCLVPALLGALSRPPGKWLPLLLLLDASAVLAQCSVLWTPAPPLAHYGTGFAFLCAGAVSAAWWQNFVHPHSFLGTVRVLAVFAARLRECRSKTYALVSPWKCVLFALCMFQFVPPRVPLRDLLRREPFAEQLLTITSTGHMNQSQIAAFQARMQDYERADYRLSGASLPPLKRPVPPVEQVEDGEALLLNGTRDAAGGKGGKRRSKGRNKRASTTEAEGGQPTQQNGASEREGEGEEETVSAYNIYEDRVELNQFTTNEDALWVAFFQCACALLCQLSAKFACKVLMQRMGLALPVLLSVPLCLALLSDACQRRALDPCHLSEWFSKELFWQCPAHPFVWANLWTDVQALLWLAWWLAQCWVCVHLWKPGQERLARSERLFVLDHFVGCFPEQSLALDRRRDDKLRIRSEDVEVDDFDDGASSTRTYESSALSEYILSDGAAKAPSVCSSRLTSSSRMDCGGLIREQASAADAICKIYVCATMWHESAREMTCMLKSIMRLDEDQCARRNAQRYLKVVDPDYYEFEAHIFVDDAFELDPASGTPRANKFVGQLLAHMDEAASTVHQCAVHLRRPRVCATPYGGRVSYLLPGKNRLTIHLKNKWLIRQRKRWSQVMYLYYLLGFRLALRVHDVKRRDLLAENTFILTLDGDVDFQPECVHLLVDLMRKNRRLGAACGRIHPRGSGLMVWYQKFEYAVGHWLQKATEHMIGCVLCSPGCFSLFRSAALMDDNVARKYATRSEKPVHYVQYDQGEDRWLCTLLLQRGYRVEYCAASDALTFAPEGFTEFFNQRRRWVPSTLANIIDLLRDYRNVVKVNESVSIWYICYQLVMLFSSVLGPGTIFLMVVGAISISFNIDTRLALVVVTTPVLCFCVCCLCCSTDTQLLLAQLIGALFAMLMTAVVVGTSLQIQKDGILSPHSIFLFTVLGSWFIAALLHPLEFTCVLPCALYFLAIPSMYMLLPIYSLCNLNTVTWGTRENPVLADEAHKSQHAQEQSEGELSLGCGSFCRVVCCVRNAAEPPQVRQLGEGLRQIERKLASLERRREAGQQQQSPPAGEQGQGPAKTRAEATDWMQEGPFRAFETVYLDANEESFWREMIDKYLKPIVLDPPEQQRMQRGLTCFAFFMVNTVFIIVVLVLQMQKDCLHIEWPLGPKVNQSRAECGGAVNFVGEGDQQQEWVMSRLQLEPMGFVFIVFFLAILIIQFLAMLCHRFGTMAHIIASTELWCCSRRPLNALSEEELMAQNAVEIARELQAIRGLHELSTSSSSGGPAPLGRRAPFPRVGPSAAEDASNNGVLSPPPPPQRENEGPVPSSLSLPGPTATTEGERRASRMARRTDTLDAAFRKRFFALSSSSPAGPPDRPGTNSSAGKASLLTLNRHTLRALERRRESIFGGGAELGRLQRLSAPPNQLWRTNGESDSDEESAAFGGGLRPTPPRAAAQIRCHRLDELFRRKEPKRGDPDKPFKQSWF